jgi:hypothetical protein
VFEALIEAIGNSQFLHSLQSIRIDCSVDLGLSGDRVRPLEKDEIQQLIVDGNTADDWQLMRVARGFKPGRIKRNEFRGQITLGRFDGTTRTPWNEEVPSGLVCSSFSNCVIGQDSLVRNVGQPTAAENRLPFLSRSSSGRFTSGKQPVDTRLGIE